MSPKVFFGEGVARPMLQYVDMGECLLHRVGLEHQSVSYHLPAASVLAALLFNHLPPPAFPAARAAILSSAILLAYAVGCLLGPPAGAALAGGFLLFFPDVWYARSGYSHFFHSLFVLLVAGLLVWRARAPSPIRSVLLGLALGAGFLFRSPLALFPPLLAALESRPKPYWKHFAALCVLPYLFLIPWIRMNWIVQGLFIPFEHNEANPAIVTGAAGDLLTTDRDLQWHDLVAGAVGDDNTGALLIWAGREISRHPLRYVLAVAARVRFAASLHPAVFVLGLLAVWVYRDRREFRHLGLLVLYYLGIHCLLSVQDGYFCPLWPILSVMAGALAARRWKTIRSAGDSALVLKVGLAFALLFAFYVGWTVNAYAQAAMLRPPASKEAWSLAQAASPRDAWLLFESGKGKLRSGDADGAAAELALAAAARPGHFERELLLDWALFLKGDSGPLLELRLDPAAADGRTREDYFVFKACAWLKTGKKERAREALSLALAARDPDFVRLVPEPAVRERLGYQSAELAEKIVVQLRAAPPAQALAALAELARLQPDYPAFWLEHASLALKTGSPASARMSLARAMILKTGPGQRLRASRLYGELRDYGEASAILRLVSQEPPAQARIWGEGAQAAARIGDRRAALDFLSRAGDWKARGGAASYLAEVYCQLAEGAAKNGDAKTALESLEQARRLKPGPDQLHRAALIYQELKEYPRAAALLARLARENPGRADYLKDEGLCEYLAGSPKEAARSLEAAIRLDPGLLPAYMTLAAIRAASKSDAEALAVYDRAVAAGAGAREPGLRAELIKSRDELRLRLGR